MKNNAHHITFQRTGRYLTYGDPVHAKHLVFALHGYGQLTPYFIRKFNSLNKNDFYIVCPEGLHRFYLKGTNGRVGASWMTKEDRLIDINDYVNFLNSVYAEVMKQYTFNTTTLIGFSQGGATASRWLAYGNCSFDKFVLWAAVFPPDMPEEPVHKLLETKNHFVIGDEDEFISLEQAKQHLLNLNRYNYDFQIMNFEGKHDIDKTTLHKLLNHESIT